MGIHLRNSLLASLETAQGRLGTQQLKTFSVMCYRMIDPCLSDEARAAVDWVANDLSGEPAETTFESVLKALQWNVINPEVARVDENRFSVEVLTMLEASPLAAAKAAVEAVSEAAKLQAIYKGAQGGSDLITEFDQHLVRSQVNGLLKRVETNLSSVNLQHGQEAS